MAVEVADAMSGPKETPHQVELNFFDLHRREAKKFAELAYCESSKLRSFYVRHCVLSAVFAAEALINRVYSEFYSARVAMETLDRLPTTEKWLLAPLLCGPESGPRVTFDAGRVPFQHFAELVRIRNWLVHSRPGHFVAARLEPWTITILETKKEIPWVETLTGSTWPQTCLPLNPFEWEAPHADQALRTLDAMVDMLGTFLPSCISREWLEETELRAVEDGASTRISVRSLWGGYTPRRSDEEA